jgi:hypothetical protein
VSQRGKKKRRSKAVDSLFVSPAARRGRDEETLRSLPREGRICLPRARRSKRSLRKGTTTCRKKSVLKGEVAAAASGPRSRSQARSVSLPPSLSRARSRYLAPLFSSSHSFSLLPAAQGDRAWSAGSSAPPRRASRGPCPCHRRGGHRDLPRRGRGRPRPFPFRRNRARSRRGHPCRMSFGVFCFRRVRFLIVD